MAAIWNTPFSGLEDKVDELFEKCAPLAVVSSRTPFLVRGQIFDNASITLVLKQVTGVILRKSLVLFLGLIP